MRVARPTARAAIWGGSIAALLIAAAIAIPALTGWNVRVRWFPPLHAEWMPRVGPGLPVAIALGVLGVIFGARLAQRLRWIPLQLVVFGGALVWLLSLALVDGLDGIGTILNHRYEYLGTAREVTDFGATLREYVDRIPYAHEDNWPVHIAGHPPGALLFFVVLVRLGLGSGLAAGLVVTLLGATIPVAVLGTLRVLGAERHARRVAPLLVFMPAAIWIAVSGDGMFAAFAAWGLWALARAATARARGRGMTRVRGQGATRVRGRGTSAMVLWSILAGLVLGYCVMLSYGLPLLGVLALAVLIAARDWRPLLIAAASALVVVLLFAVNGFAWWEAFPVLQQRYWDGVASRRPPGYWMWGNFAAFAISAGPLVGASLAAVISVGVGRWRGRRTVGVGAGAAVGAGAVGAGASGAAVTGASGSNAADAVEADTAVANAVGAGAGDAGTRAATEAGSESAASERRGIRVVLLLTAAAWLIVLLADLSQMSRAEVERIWLPFVPWALLGLSLYSPRVRQVALALQIAFALVVQTLLQTGW